MARIASVAGRLNGDSLVARPFRAPHHSVSPAGLVGGGNPPRAGEVTLAHRGVLFLDELGEFARQALESLRAPLEDGTVTVTRARHRVELPCRFMLVAAANPCPCGRGEDDERCRCTPFAVRRYQAKLSGAVADRIDIWQGVAQPGAAAMGGAEGEASAAVRERVAAARTRQGRRLGPGRCNAELRPDELRHLDLEPDARELLEAPAGSERPRARSRARGCPHDRRPGRRRRRVAVGHVQEALGLRRPL